MWHAEFSSGAKSKKSLIYSSEEGTLFALNAIRVTCGAPGLPRVSSSSATESESESTNENPGGTTNPDPSRLTPNTNRDPRAIPLPESTETLSVLFQFILPKPPPTLEDLGVRNLVEVLTAARKYKVYTVVSIGESRLFSLAVDWDAETLFVYGITNKLTRFMNPGAPRVYRNVKREELLEICNEHGVLYAWNRYQLLWDRIIEEACEVAFESIPHHGKVLREIYKHYSNLRSLQWETSWGFEVPKVSYDQFLAILNKDTLTLAVDGPVGSGPHPNSSEKVNVKHVNDKIKKMIEDLPAFSSFLESNQKDGDVAFEGDGLDSEEEEEEEQDGSG